MEQLEPYKKILEEQLWTDIMKNFITPNKPLKSIVLPARSVIISELPKRMEESFSTIINDEHVAKISSWIDRKSAVYPLSSVPYEFRLVLKGTRDGFDHQTFWDISHGHTNTVIVARIKGTDEIIGGYNPLTWDKTINDIYLETKNSFVFSLKNGNIQSSILSRVKNTTHAFYIDPRYFGPVFGSGISFLYNGYIYITTYNYYEKPIKEPGSYNMTDYEVFDVMEKYVIEETT
ncbi:16989_t:CDS:1 [Acaulospora colombiana]|uniref:16989_t:CDS:1 n=1 Tax=Acaulospora colombiana TaxID=27376 RepID=A0ACA9PLL8_9GLOM|nr:16989_t:CDS:1 [Acaulospora colombiana]